jgi:hypothetical protein
MNKYLLAVALLAGCSPGQNGGNQAAPTGSGQTAKVEPARLGALTGLYEGGNGGPRHQMCVVEGKGGGLRFGLVVWGGNTHSCSGSGTIRRQGDRVRLVMAGDSPCELDAVISGKGIRFPHEVPSGCAYYCGARASLAGAELTQTGTSRKSALSAKDIVGDPLCGPETG